MKKLFDLAHAFPHPTKLFQENSHSILFNKMYLYIQERLKLIIILTAKTTITSHIQQHNDKSPRKLIS